MGKFLVSLIRLSKWFHRQKRVLPWRDDPTFYRVWISEIMLQQTQVITVVPYFERFMARFPSVEKLANAPEEDVLFMWAGLGYYSRARNLHRGAKMIVAKGAFPATREEWLEIPGVGNYTAGAILSIAGGLPEAILDGNVERVLSRVRRVSRQNGDTGFKERLWRLSRIFVEKANEHKIEPSVLNQALMELGATHCSPKNPKCDLCPLTDLCRAREKGDQSEFPPKKKPKQWLHKEETLYCMLNDSGKVLVRQRQKGEWRAGLWDLLDELPATQFPKAKRVATVETKHIVTRHKIHRTTEVWKIPATAAWKTAEPNSAQPSQIRWIDPQAPEVAVGSALKRTLKAVLQQSTSEV